MLQGERRADPGTDAQMCDAVRRINAGDPAGALAPLLDILSHSPGNAEARYALAAAQLRSGNPDAALAEFETVLDQVGAHDGAAYGRGLALFALGERRAALKVFRHLTRPGPFAWKAWASIADITPHEDERKQALRSAAGTLAAICGQSGAASDRRTAAAALIAARRPAEAVALLTRNTGPVSGAPMPDRLLARALYHQGRFEDAFIEACRLLAHTRVIGAPNHRPVPFRPDTAEEVLAEILDILSAAGAAAFLAGGTLLGFHRSGGPLAHDRDVDIGVIRNADGGPDIAAILRAHDRILLPKIARPGDRYFGVEHRGVAVDIFLYDEGGRHFTCGFSELPGDIQWRFTQFDITSAIYGRRSWPIPVAPERYLAETYGPAWQVPDKGFASAVSSPALYRTDAYVRAYYAASRARTALITGDASKARALIRQSPVPVPGFAAGELHGAGDRPA